MAFGQGCYSTPARWCRASPDDRGRPFGITLPRPLPAYGWVPRRARPGCARVIGAPLDARLRSGARTCVARFTQETPRSCGCDAARSSFGGVWYLRGVHWSRRREMGSDASAVHAGAFAHLGAELGLKRGCEVHPDEFGGAMSGLNRPCQVGPRSSGGHCWAKADRSRSPRRARGAFSGVKSTIAPNRARARRGFPRVRGTSEVWCSGDGFRA